MDFLSMASGAMSGGAAPAAGALSSALASTPSSASGDITGSPISISPVGINFGEIIKPYNEGSLSNGGYGIYAQSRLKPVVDTVPYFTTAQTVKHFPWVYVAGGSVLLILTVLLLK